MNIQQYIKIKTLKKSTTLVHYFTGAETRLFYTEDDSRIKNIFKKNKKRIRNLIYGLNYYIAFFLSLYIIVSVVFNGFSKKIFSLVLVLLLLSLKPIIHFFALDNKRKQKNIEIYKSFNKEVIDTTIFNDKAFLFARYGILLVGSIIVLVFALDLEDMEKEQTDAIIKNIKTTNNNQTKIKSNKNIISTELKKLDLGKNTLKNKIMLTITIDSLRVRVNPNIDSEKIENLSIGSVVEFIEKSKNQTTVIINNNKITAYWYKVKTSSSKIGWVHGCCIDVFKVKDNKNNKIKQSTNGIGEQFESINNIIYDKKKEKEFVNELKHIEKNIPIEKNTNSILKYLMKMKSLNGYSDSEKKDFLELIALRQLLESSKIKQNTTIDTIFDKSTSTVKYETVISADKMNVVYSGVDNPITVFIPGVSTNIIKVFGPGLSSRGKRYIMKPPDVREVTITANATLPNGKSVTSKKIFRVKDIPSPIGLVRGTDDYQKMSKSSLLKSSIKSELKDFIFDLKIGVASFKVKVPGKPSIACKGTHFSSEAKRAIGRADRGDVIIIYDIKSVLLNNTGYALKKTSSCIIEITS